MSLLDHPDAKAFILHWGEMGTHWGVNRSVAQIHALLYLSDRPLHADDIVDQLRLARSNVSTGLKELQGYGIVRRAHVEGDRRDHFVAETDLWEMLMRISAERKRREIDPTIALLAELSARLAARRSARPCPRADQPDARVHLHAGRLVRPGARPSQADARRLDEARRQGRPLRPRRARSPSTRKEALPSHPRPHVQAFCFYRTNR